MKSLTFSTLKIHFDLEQYYCTCKLHSLQLWNTITLKQFVFYYISPPSAHSLGFSPLRWPGMVRWHHVHVQNSQQHHNLMQMKDINNCWLIVKNTANPKICMVRREPESCPIHRDKKRSLLCCVGITKCLPNTNYKQKLLI